MEHVPVLFVYGRRESYQNYTVAMTAVGGLLRFSLEIGEAEGCDGLLLPGGGDLEPWRYEQGNTASRGLEPERDRAELDLLGQFTAAGRPVLGICRGLQTVNVFFGGTLIQDLPGHRAVGERDRLHVVSTAPDPLGRLWGKRPVVNSAHHQAVDRLGEGLRAVQWAPDGTVEALVHRTLPVWAVQWHPERLTGALAVQGAADGGRLLGAFLALCRHT